MAIGTKMFQDTEMQITYTVIDKTLLKRAEFH